MRTRHLLIVATLICLFVSGCSTSHSPVSPDIDNVTLQGQSVFQRHKLMAFNLFEFDTATRTVKSIPVRNAADHWNILTFLENGPCTTCVTVTGWISNSEYDTIFVRLTHPFTGANLTGFDVRGIFMTHGSRFYPEAKIVTSLYEQDEVEFIDAHGFTSLYNPTTWGFGPGGLQGYLPGRFSSDDWPSTTLNGYRIFSSDDDDNTRNAFYAGDVVEEYYRLKIPDIDKFIVGYAVDASWVPPDTIPVTDPMEDFPFSANCPEPYQINGWANPAGAWTNNGGEIFFGAHVFDHGGADTHAAPVIECPEAFEGVKELELISDDIESSYWGAAIANENLPDLGEYQVLVKIEDDENANSPDHLDLTTYQTMRVEVEEGGWVKTWGGTYMDFANDVIYSVDGSIYVTGHFYNTIDLDPGEGVEEYTSNGYEDAYLSKFDSDGNLLWTRVWGADYHESGTSLAIEPATSDEIYVCGYFNNTVDFDPGPGVVEFTSHGDWDSYVSKFDPDGNLVWTRAWGSNMWDKALDVSIESHGVYACGFFRGECDFDPGAGVDSLTFNPGASYVTKFDLDGNHEWVKAWAGDGAYGDLARAVAVADGTVDLDPGGGVSLHSTPTAYQDTYLSKFNPDGSFDWGVTWGSDGDDHAYDVNPHGYVTGNFLGTVDFNPDPDEVAEFTAVADRDAYVVKFNSWGIYQWAKTWGGDDGIGNDDVIGYKIALDSGLNVYVAGTFNGTCDLDPSDTGVDERISMGQEDIFVLCLSPDGDYVFSNALGSPGPDYCYGIDVGHSFEMYIGGAFQDTVDFNPTELFEHNVTSNGNFDCYLQKYIRWGQW